MPGTLRVNLTGTNNAGNELLNYVRATQVGIRHMTIALESGVTGQFVWPDPTGTRFVFILFSLPDSDGGELTVTCSGLTGNIIKCNFPLIASGDQLMLLLPKTKEIISPVATIIDMDSTVDVDIVDAYFF